MNNEDKILELLTQMQSDISDLKTGQARLEKDVKDLKSDVKEIKTDVKYIWEDISRQEKRIDTLAR